MSAINKLSDHGMFFWDYGNAFLLEASRAGNLLVRFSMILAHVASHNFGDNGFLGGCLLYTSDAADE